jgi:hypothetical protein
MTKSMILLTHFTLQFKYRFIQYLEETLSLKHF